MPENEQETDEDKQDTLLKETFYVVLAYASFFVMPPVVMYEVAVPNFTPVSENDLYILLLSLVILMFFGVLLSGAFMNKARRIKHNGPPPMP